MTALVLVVLAAAFGIFAWFDPRRAVLWFPVMLPAYVLRAKIGPLPTTLLELSFLALAAGTTLKLGWDAWHQSKEKLKPWRLAMSAWIIATLISVLVAPDRLAALGLWRAYVLEPLLYFALLLGFLKDERDRRELLCSLVAVAVVLGFWASFQFMTNINIPHPWDTTDILQRRATGPFPFPNALSLFCAPLAALFFGLTLFRIQSPQSSVQSPQSQAKSYKLKAKSYSLWLGFAAGTLATVLAKSVGGMLGILCAVFIAIIWNERTRVAAIVAAMVIAIFIAITPAVRTPIVNTLAFKEWSGKVRLIIWKETWSMLKDKPVLGAGLGAYPEAIKPYHQATWMEIFQYPHNIFLNIWSETGLLGVLAFALIVITWFRLAIRPDARTSSFEIRHSSFEIVLILPLIAILVQGLADVPYFKNDLAMLFWTLAALATPGLAKTNVMGQLT